MTAYNKEILHALDTKVGPLLIGTISKYINLERISIDSANIISTRTDMYRIWLLYTYLYEYTIDSSEEEISKLLKMINGANKISMTTGVSIYSGITDTVGGSGETASTLYAGVGLNGGSYNTTTNEIWSLDDLLASPTDNIIVQSNL